MLAIPIHTIIHTVVTATTAGVIRTSGFTAAIGATRIGMAMDIEVIRGGAIADTAGTAMAADTMAMAEATTATAADTPRTTAVTGTGAALTEMAAAIGEALGVQAALADPRDSRAPVAVDSRTEVVLAAAVAGAVVIADQLFP